MENRGLLYKMYSGKMSCFLFIFSLGIFGCVSQTSLLPEPVCVGQWRYEEQALLKSTQPKTQDLMLFRGFIYLALTYESC